MSGALNKFYIIFPAENVSIIFTDCPIFLFLVFTFVSLCSIRHEVSQQGKIYLSKFKCIILRINFHTLPPDICSFKIGSTLGLSMQFTISSRLEWLLLACTRIYLKRFTWTAFSLSGKKYFPASRHLK